MELLLVLSVVTITAAVVLPLGHNWMKKQSEDEALEAFTAAVHEMQLYSIANRRFTWINFTNGFRVYYWGEPGYEEIGRAEFPPTMRLGLGSYLKRIEFDGNGRIVRSGRLTFETSTGLLDIRMQLHRGRMIVYRHE